MCVCHYFRKSVMSVKFPPAILGRKWLRQFYGRLAFFSSFCWENPHAHKIPPFRGGGSGLFLEGGWKCQFEFYGRGEFSDCFCSNGIRVPKSEFFKCAFGPRSSHPFSLFPPPLQAPSHLLPRFPLFTSPFYAPFLTPREPKRPCHTKNTTG